VTPPAEPSSGAASAPLVTRAFVVLFASTLAFFVAGGIVVPIAPEYADRQLDASATAVGGAIAVYSLAALAFRPVVGWASDRYGRRPVLLVGAVVAILAYAIHLAATPLPIFVGARAALGVGEAFFFVAAVAMASDLARAFPPLVAIA
jgi:MFS family permease